MEPVKAENTHPTKLCSDKERLSDNLPRVKKLAKPHASLVVRHKQKKNSPEFSKPTTTKAKKVQIDQLIKSEIHTVTEQKSKHRSDDRKPIHLLKSSSTGTKQKREQDMENRMRPSLSTVRYHKTCAKRATEYRRRATVDCTLDVQNLQDEAI